MNITLYILLNSRTRSDKPTLAIFRRIVVGPAGIDLCRRQKLLLLNFFPGNGYHARDGFYVDRVDFRIEILYLHPLDWPLLYYYGDAYTRKRRADEFQVPRVQYNIIVV